LFTSERAAYNKNMFRRLGTFFLDIIQVVVFAVSIFLFVYLLIMQPHKIKGNSMEPNFHNAQYLLTDKVSYRFGEPKRGDVVVFKAPPDDKDEFIKRVIGLPGERVSLKAGRFYINDQLLEEKYLPSSQITSGGQFLAEGQSATIPESSYFMVGDNRDHSFDSRAWGFIGKSKITGRAWLLYWPPESVGIIRKTNYNF
jgi:signal peptidase I